jgi:hypothetical protein
MKGHFISKVHQVRRAGDTFESVFRIFDQDGTYLELTPAQLHEVITVAWFELDQPDWSAYREEIKGDGK